MIFPVAYLGPKSNCLVVLHNFLWVGAEGRIFFHIFFSNQSQRLKATAALIGSCNQGRCKRLFYTNIIVFIPVLNRFLGAIIFYGIGGGIKKLGVIIFFMKNMEVTKIIKS